MMRKALVVVASLLWMAAAGAQTIIGALPFTLQNGSIADANQVMADFNSIVAAVNANAANAGANSNITALNGLTTPLPYTAGGSSVYISGTSSGSSNAYVVASPIPTGFTLITGKRVVFFANFTNNGPATLNVAGTGVLNLFRQTTAGPQAMVGGEVVNGQAIDALYDGTQYECMNCAQTGLIPPGTTIDYSGVVIPAGFLQATGQAVSRTTFAALFNAINYTSVSATTSNGSASVVVANSSLYQLGWYVGGNNVTCNTYITSIPDGAHIVLQNTAGASGATTLTIGPSPQGDCSTTFNTPNYTGKVLAGVDGFNNITSVTCVNATSIGDKQGVGNVPCGTQTQTLTLAQLPTGIASSVTQTITVTANHIPNANAAITNALSGTGGGNVAFSSGGTFSDISSISGSNTINVTSNNTNGAAHPILMPTSLVYKIIKT